VSTLTIKIPSKNLGRQRCAEVFNSGVKGLIECGQSVQLLNVKPAGASRNQQALKG
jgi:hypothetical protein